MAPKTLKEDATEAPEEILMVDPSEIVVDDNIRYGLKKLSVDKLMDDIIAYGGVHTPTEAEPLAEPAKGKRYRLTVGHYRHAAVTRLNAEQSAGLKLPVIVRENGDETARLRRQLSENVERQDLSPMDSAVAIRKLLAAGVPRIEIRKIFSRPSGKKGLALYPASNAWVNIMASLLDLPKAIQEKIHDGRIGVGAAYELTKVPAEKRQSVLDRAEKERLAEIDREEREEAKYLKAEQATQAERDEASAAEAKAKDLAAALEASRAVTLDKKATVEEASKVPENYLSMAEKDKKLIAERLGGAKQALREAEKAEKKAADAVAKLAPKAPAAAKAAPAKAKPVAKKGSAGRGKSSPESLGAGDIKKAAQKEGVGKGPVALNLKETRAALGEMCIPTYPIVTKAINFIFRCLDGIDTPTQTMRELARLVKEKNPVPKD